jgi:hypothetical protein
MSTSQQNTKIVADSYVVEKENIGESAHGPDRTIEDPQHATAANTNNPSVSTSTEQDANFRLPLTPRPATSQSEPDEGEGSSATSQGHSPGKARVSLPSHVIAEIRELQQRISQLEAETTQQPRKPKSQKHRPGKSTDRPDDETTQDDKDLRKLIRRAPYGRRWVENAEARAGETEEDRKQYGKRPNTNKYGLGQENTMYHVAKDGNMLPGNMIDVAFVSEGNNWRREREDKFSFIGDALHRLAVEPDPLRGMRPPKSLRPIYHRTEGSHRSRLPPTEWDTSDTEEWSSDTSTKSRDFDYYRARLRGDFEWELDRLNAQVRRYKTRQEKKHARRLADRAKAEDEKMERELEQGVSQHDMGQAVDIQHTKTSGKYGTPSLNTVDWYRFRAARSKYSQGYYAIDVLIGEPKISDTPWALNLRGLPLDVDSKAKTSISDRTSAALGADLMQDPEENVREITGWSGQAPLPERIRINSRPIIDHLSKIHGSELCPEQGSHVSVVMLRPFRMLNIYDKEIRELCARLANEHPPELSSSDAESAIRATVSSGSGSHDSPSTGNADIRTSTHESTIDLVEKAENKEHLGCLLDFMNNYIGKKKDFLNSTHCEKVNFSDLWYLFIPGTLVISSNGKQAYRVASLRSKRHKSTDNWAAYRVFEGNSNKDDSRADIAIICVSIDFDGRNLGPVVETFGINKFDGEKDVTSLEVFPFRFHVLKEINEQLLKPTGDSPLGSREEKLENGIQKLRKRLIARGKLFISAATAKHMYYRGLTVDTRDEIESQVIIDFEEAFSGESRRGWRPEIRRLIGTVLDPEPDGMRRGCDGPCCWQENVHDESYVETEQNLAFMNNMMNEIRDTPYKMPSVMVFPRSLEEASTGVNALTDDELIIMSYSAPGYILRDRSWGKYSILQQKPRIHLSFPK